MKKILFLIYSILSISCSYNIQKFQEKNNVVISTTTSKGTTTGDIRYHTIKTDRLKSQKRDIVVYLPPSYNLNSQKRYPVLYMHDGQNIFDKYTSAFGKEWFVDEKVDFLIKKNVIEEIIVVGIYNGLSERINEYTWNKDPQYGGGEGKNYAEFIVNNLKPFIDKNYRTKADRENTALLGSSLGGLISFYLINNYKNYFGKAGFMSPSFWWNNKESTREKINFTNSTIWLDCGTREGTNYQSLIDNVNTVYNNILKVESNDVLKYIHEGAEHNEEAWATRVHGPLIHFFGKEKDKAKKFDLIKRLMILEEWGKI